jgi:hypothetical protein
MEINEFFNNLNKDIQEAKTKKALRVLSKRSKNFSINIINSGWVNPSVKKDVAKKYKKSQKLIKTKERGIK